MRYTLIEALSGIKRNFSMAIAVIMTMSVSLTLFGMSVLTFSEVEKVKGRWYDKVEVSIFLCTQDSAGTASNGNCERSQAVTDEQRENIKNQLENNPDVSEVFYETKQEAYDDFRRTYSDSPLLDSLTVDQMQDSFRVKLVDPQNYQDVITQAKLLPGVQNVVDMQQALDPIFDAVKVVQWATLGTAVLLLLAATLQIGNSIRMSAFTRRREISIMRLVGASNSYILLPFLLESLFAGLVSIILTALTTFGTYSLLSNAKPKSKLSLESLPWITWTDAWIAVGLVAIVGVTLSIIPTLVATRRYLRV